MSDDIESVDKYVLVLDADDDVGAEQRENAAGLLVERARSASPDLVGLTVGTVLEPLTGPASTIAVVQAWVDTSGDAEGLLASLTDAVAPKLSVWTTSEIVFRAPTVRVAVSGDHNRINLFGTAARRDDFTVDAFFEYWKTIHAPISGAVPGTTGYVVSRVERTVEVAVDRTVDGFIELWWPSHESFVAAGDSPAQAAAWEDVQNYARTDGHFWLTHEHVVIVPPATGPGLLEKTTG